MKTLTLTELKEAINTNRVVFLKSRKMIFILDGSKNFKATKECIEYYKCINSK